RYVTREPETIASTTVQAAEVTDRTASHPAASRPRTNATPADTMALIVAQVPDRTARMPDHAADVTARTAAHPAAIRPRANAIPAATVVLIHSHACRIHPTTAFHAAMVNAFTLSQLAMINATSATTAMMISPIGPIAISHAAAIFAAAMSDWMPMRTHPA